MNLNPLKRLTVLARTEELLPRFGMAWLRDDHDREWAITRSTEGPGIDDLQGDQCVRLDILYSSEGPLVEAYEIADGRPIG